MKTWDVFETNSTISELNFCLKTSVRHVLCIFSENLNVSKVFQLLHLLPLRAIQRLKTKLYVNESFSQQTDESGDHRDSLIWEEEGMSLE